jgi:murein DD-endopeptidase MepM/ murein hydrolase activator NlpD
MVGLRNEWIGLRKVPDATLQRAIAVLNASSPFNSPENLLPKLVYKVGNLGYGSTGPHLDVKPVKPKSLKADPGLPAITAKELDRYVFVGPQKRPLSQGTTTTDNDQKHRNRNSFGHDFATANGTPVFLANGARVVGTYKGDQGTDHTIIELPDGRRYQFLHGTNA